MGRPCLTIQEAEYNLDTQLFLLDKKQKEGKFLLEDIGEFLPVGLLINHRDGRNCYMNNMSMEHLNYYRDEVMELGNGYQRAILWSNDEYIKFANKIEEFYQRGDSTEVLSFFQRLRPKGSDTYKWMYVTSKLLRDPDKPEMNERVLVASPADLMGEMSNQINRLLEENHYLKKNYNKFASLTKREKEIISLLYNGLKNNQIADKLFISRHTVEQHRKNINRKLGFKSFVDVIKFAEVYELF